VIENNGQTPMWSDIKVDSEEQAFALIKQALDHNLNDEHYRIVFDKWPVISITLEGKGYDSTITSDMAEGIVALQSSINRIYARLVHNSPSAKSLTLIEKDQLKFKAKVEKGSSKYEIDLTEWATKLTNSLVDKMSPEQLVTLVVTTVAVAGSYYAWKAYLRHKSEDKKVDSDMHSRIALSQEETKRQQILAEAFKQHPVLPYIAQDADSARTEILKGVGDANMIKVAGIELDNTTAKSVARASRSEPVDIQLNGNYEISSVSWQPESEVRMKVVSVDDGRSFIATFNDHSINGDQIKLLQNAEWSRSKVYLSINATELRGEITTAKIVGVSEQPALNS